MGRLGRACGSAEDFDGAEAQYKKAQQIDSRRGDAYFNLGVLYKDFRANKVNDPDPIKALQASQQMYRTARDYFQQFLDKDGDPNDKTEFDIQPPPGFHKVAGNDSWLIYSSCKVPTG